VRRILKKIATSILVLGCLVGVERFCHRQTRGFTIQAISSDSPYDFLQPHVPEVEALLAQPFYFLASGGQSYVFISQDGSIVLKLFKHHHMRLWKWLHQLPLPHAFESVRQQFLEKRLHQSPQFLESCQIAYQSFRERTGLIYLHLNKTTHFRNHVLLVDNLGIVHPIDPNTTDFALQRKGVLPHRKFKQLLERHDLESFKRCIDSIVTLIFERCQQGIGDRDLNIRRNLAFLGEQAIEIDLGSYTHAPHLKEPEQCRAELIEKTKKFHHWLYIRNPELAQHLLQQIEHALIKHDRGQSLI